MADEPEILLDVRDLKTWFASERGAVRAVDGVSFTVSEGRTTALVGESGCGKSVTALSLSRLVPEPPGYYPGGQILFKGEDVLRMDRRRLAALRGAEIAYVFQEPATALNPVFTVGRQIGEAIRLHQLGSNVTRETEALLRTVGLPDPAARCRAYPHELSGGMKQRVMLAIALACRPSLLIADEPTTALDVTIQRQILELVRRLQDTLAMAVLFITHDLGLVAEMAGDVNVMYAGRIVESGPVDSVLKSPAHHYTRGLLDALPVLDVPVESGEVSEQTHRRRRLRSIGGSVPDPVRLPPGCRFAPRCPKAQVACQTDEPQMSTKDSDHLVRCWFPL